MSLPFLQSKHEEDNYSYEVSPAVSRMDTVFRAIVNGEQAVELLRAAKIQATSRKAEGENKYGQYMHLSPQHSDRINFRTKYSNFIADKAAKEFIDPPVPVLESAYATVAPGTPSILEEEPLVDAYLFDAVAKDMKEDKAIEQSAVVAQTTVSLSPQDALIENARSSAISEAISAEEAYGHIAQVTNDN